MFDFRKLICLYPEQIRNNSQGQATAFGEASVPADGVGVFITTQSIVTFPAASSAVSVIYKIIARFFPTLSGNDFIILGISFFIGAFLYFYSINDDMSSSEKLRALGLAFLNSLFLASSALGLDKITN